MSFLVRFVLCAAVLSCALDSGVVHAEKKTVCTITVNSADEKDAFRRSLPADKYQFVELVERGRPDWLESACRQGTRCDILIVSGHYDGGNEFFSDQVAAHEFLPVDEMERVSCSASCPGLFAQLKEVYLFGCNTLDPGANRSASAEIGRSLVRAGHSRADAERLARALIARHGESSRDRMRLIFKDVPSIYGFSSVAPLGRTAGSLLSRHFQSNGAGEIGSGRVHSRLLGAFSAHSMVTTSGLAGTDPLLEHRRDICQFADDRLSPAQKLDFIHGLFGREIAEARLFLDRIERYAARLDDHQRDDPDVVDALDRIARDDGARSRFLAFARDADQPSTRARMVGVARTLGWLGVDEYRAEIVRMVNDQFARNAVGAAEVDLVCGLNRQRELDADAGRVVIPAMHADKVSASAVLACMGQPRARERVVQALSSPSDDDVQIAQVYLRHHPIREPGELRAVAVSVAQMAGTEAQVRALQTLAHFGLSDRESLEAITRLYPMTESAGVQTAIASVLIRADYRSIAGPELVQSLREHRLKAGNGQDSIDVLIRRLEAQSMSPDRAQ